jgi:N-acetylneuraminic acid mutarotase
MTLSRVISTLNLVVARSLLLLCFTNCGQFETSLDVGSSIKSLNASSETTQPTAVPPVAPPATPKVPVTAPPVTTSTQMPVSVPVSAPVSLSPGWKNFSDAGAYPAYDVDSFVVSTGGVVIANVGRASARKFDPANGKWASLTPGVVRDRNAVYAASPSSVFQWVGRQSGGEVYNVGADSWTAILTENSPSDRSGASAVAVGEKFFVWGGTTAPSTYVADGGIYDASLKSWQPLTSQGVLEGREGATSLWTGENVIVWGGLQVLSGRVFFKSDGAIYNPAANSWKVMSTDKAPYPRINPAMVWTGKKLIVWGGVTYDNIALNSGGIYDPALDKWTEMTINGAPSARRNGVGAMAAYWDGTKMVIYGGASPDVYQANGGFFDPETNSWQSMPVGPLQQPGGEGEYGQAAVHLGSGLFVWQGCNTTKTDCQTSTWTYGPMK